MSGGRSIAVLVVFLLSLFQQMNATQQEIKYCIKKKNYERLGLLLRRDLHHDISIKRLEKLAKSYHSTPLVQALDTTRNIDTISLGTSRAKLLQTLLFIQTNLPRKGQYHSKRKTKLPYAVEVDPRSKQAYIVLEGKKVQIGKGKKKVVAKAIMYDKDHPKVIARALQKSPMDQELSITKRMQGKKGIFKVHGFTSHKHGRKTHTAIYSKFYKSGSLRTIFDKKQSFTFKEKVTIAYQLACGLESLHKEGIVHSDLGARNYLLEIDKGQIHATVADLGRATFTKKMQGHPKVQGNMSYGAPEGLKINKLSPKDYYATDVFAMGTVFYELFYGKRPPWHAQWAFKHRSESITEHLRILVKQIQRATKNRRLALREKKRSSVEQFEYLILKMLHTNPKSRPTATRLRITLEKMI